MGVFSATFGLLAALLPTEPPAKLPCPPGPDITLAAAARCVGETRTVVGRIDHVSRSPKGVVFVNFCADYRACPFTAVVFRDKVPVFADLARRSGSEVAITGQITTYRGSPQIVLERAEQVVVRAPPLAPVVRIAPKPIVRPAAKPFAESEVDTDSAPAPAPIAAPVVDATPAPDGVSRYGVFEAATHVGESVRVRGRVEKLVRDGGDLLVVFSGAGREAPFVVVVLEPMVEGLEPVARGWVGHEVELAGDVTLFNGRAAMFVNEPAQVTRVLPARAER